MKAFATENIRNLAVIGHGDAGKTQLVSSLALRRRGQQPLGKGRRRHDRHRLRRGFDRTKSFAQQQFRPPRIQRHKDKSHRHARLCGVRLARPARLAGRRLCSGRRRRRSRHRGPDRKDMAVRERIHAAAFHGDQQDRQGARRFRPRTRDGVVEFCPLDRSLHPADRQRKAISEASSMSSIKKHTNSTRTAKPKRYPIPSEGNDIFDRTRERLIEIVAESDDALMEKYFENGTLPEEDIYPNLAKAIASEQAVSRSTPCRRQRSSGCRYCSITSSSSHQIRQRTSPNTDSRTTTWPATGSRESIPTTNRSRPTFSVRSPTRSPAAST